VREAHRQKEAGLRCLSEVAIVGAVVAVISVRAIRGDLAFYLASWCSVIGFLAVVVSAASLLMKLENYIGATRTFITTASSACVLLVLVLVAPVKRISVIGAPDRDVSELAPAVDRFLRAQPDHVPTVRIASHNAWPIAVGVVLYLCKSGRSVAVEQTWTDVVGRPLAETPGEHAELLFADDALAAALIAQPGLVEIASGRDVHVLWQSVRGSGR
jgi:hypothetical protein